LNESLAKEPVKSFVYKAKVLDNPMEHSPSVKADS